jgi:hypothetical protein
MYKGTVTVQHNLCNCAIGNWGFKLRGSRVEKYFLNSLGYHGNLIFTDRDGFKKWVYSVM